MAPSRKSRSVNKRLLHAKEDSPSKDGESGSKYSKRKRKLSDMLGPQWIKDELERFYKAFRKHGKDWEKVAISVRTRSADMVEALYSMNKAYLSLPKGYASSAGLIAMMTDHYSNLGDSDSEREDNQATKASQKPLKRARKSNASDTPPVVDLLQTHSEVSFWKTKRDVSRPWAVGKRTPRVPVSHYSDKDNGEKYVSPIRQGLKSNIAALDDDVAHEIALALTEASHRGGSPQVSRTPRRKMGTPSPAQNGDRLHGESLLTSAKLHGGEMDEDECELSLGSSEANAGESMQDISPLKGKKFRGRKSEVEESIVSHPDDIKEACSGTEEGQKLGIRKGKMKMDVSNAKLARSSNNGPRKRSKKVLFEEDEDAALDALQTLADLSLRPETPVDTASSVDVAEEEKPGKVSRSKLKGTSSTPGDDIASSFKASREGKVSPPGTSEAQEGKGIIRKRRQKSFPFNVSELEELTDLHKVQSQKVEAADETTNFGYSFDAVYSRQGKVSKPLERTSSSTDHGREPNDSVLSTIPVSASKFTSPTRMRSRRKLNAPEPFSEKDAKSSEKLLTSQSNVIVPAFSDTILDLKEKLSNFLVWNRVRNWCLFEWFYSAIDYPWFAKREFVEYLDHVGLGHIPRLTRVEWGVIRSSLGKPRRFSEQFLKEEKEKLNQYRESVRKHYAELRAGTREGLPTDLARPLSVGQRIFARHPRTREIHDGSVLTVDHDRYCVQFDQPTLGVEFVMDVDCMPMNPLENLPASLTRQNISFNNLSDSKISGQSVENKIEGYMKVAPSEDVENSNGLLHLSPSTYKASSLLQQGKGISTGVAVTVNNQPAANTQASVLAHLQAKEADVLALSELTRVLDKKEAVVYELKHLNEEVFENQKNGENSLTEHFKKHYAAVLLQLNEVNEQVSSALLCLRQRNTYQGSIPPTSMKPVPGRGKPDEHGDTSDHRGSGAPESGSHVVEIVEGSKAKAQIMVDAAVQAMSSLEKEKSCIESIEEAIDFVNNQLSVDDMNTPAIRSSTATNAIRSNAASQDQLSSTSETENNGSDKMNSQTESQIPSDLIAQCVATLLMIQKCTERQFPPSDVAQVLDSAVSNLKPCCSQNWPIYADIQKCMGIIRNQILALIPT